MSEQHGAEHDRVLEALARSVDRLDADPCSRLSPAFRQRARAALLMAAKHSRWPGRAWFGRRWAVVVTGLAFLLAGMPALAGPGGLSGTVTQSVRHVFGAASENDRVIVLQEVTLEPSETVEPTESVEPTETTEPTATVEPTQTVEPSPTVAPTKTVEPSPTVEPTETVGPTETVKPTPEPTETDEPTPAPVRDVARDNHGRAVSEVAKSNNGEGNHGQKVREVARDNHGQGVSEAAKRSDESEEAPETVPDVARDNHGAQVREAAHSQEPRRGAGGGRRGAEGR